MNEYKNSRNYVLHKIYENVEAISEIFKETCNNHANSRHRFKPINISYNTCGGGGCN